MVVWYGTTNCTIYFATTMTDSFFLSAFPAELANRILTEYTTGRDLSTLAFVLLTSKEHNDAWIGRVQEIGRKKLGQVASYIEQNYPRAREGEANSDTFLGVEWIRTISYSCAKHWGNPSNHASRKQWMHQFSMQMALLDFLQDRGQFEWPVWMGQICVEGSRGGTRLRNTARVVLTAPLGRPSFLPGSGLIRNQTPSTMFRGELYNLVPTPPWASVRPLTPLDATVLRPVADRLLHNNHIACPAGFHHHEILDVRILTLQQAKRLLEIRRWQMRNDWMVETADQNNDDENFRLLCCWHDDSSELIDPQEYLTYIVDLLRARERLLKSTDVSSREYEPT